MPSMDNHSLQSHHDFFRQTPDHWDNRKAPAVHQHTPSIDRNMLHHQQHEILVYMDLLALASGNDTSLCVEMEMSEIIN